MSKYEWSDERILNWLIENQMPVIQVTEYVTRYGGMDRISGMGCTYAPEEKYWRVGRQFVTEHASLKEAVRLQLEHEEERAAASAKGGNK